MEVQLQSEHAWLAKLAGEWTSEGRAMADENGGMSTYRGSETGRMLDGAWLVLEGRSEGGEHPSIMTLGYDTARRKFVGTFVTSMMTHMWLYEGTLSGNTLSLDTEGPGYPDAAITAKYVDTIELLSDDHRVLRSRILGADGKWVEFMETHYRRQ